MGTSHLQDAALTNIDATPSVRPTIGEGAGGFLRHNNGSATPAASDAAGSTYEYIRLPSNAKVKSVSFESAAQGTGKIQLGIYYSPDNSGPLNTATIANNGLTKNDFFASDIDCASAVAKGDYTNTSGNYTADKRNQPLWKALGLSVDPRCNFSVVGTVHTTAVTTGTGLTGVGVNYEV
jgi:hypothetical protein